MPLVGNGAAVCAYAFDGRGLDPAWPRTKLNLLPPQRSGHGRMRNVVVSTDPIQRSTRSVEGGGFFDLFFSEALAADGDALLTSAVATLDLEMPKRALICWVVSPETYFLTMSSTSVATKIRLERGRVPPEAGRGGESRMRPRRSDHFLPR
jgi:hypothetical protein